MALSSAHWNPLRRCPAICLRHTSSRLAALTFEVRAARAATAGEEPCTSVGRQGADLIGNLTPTVAHGWGDQRPFHPHQADWESSASLSPFSFLGTWIGM
ncbi:hypothetical protein BaRGS_00036084 [Batillaria attramentaria]|uniref:Uncharacterized protein n=1 Tax=Batillaria attramentaria TaxID=370345 RepID=A0ABD0JCP5_9CAEN